MDQVGSVVEHQHDEFEGPASGVEPEARFLIRNGGLSTAVCARPAFTPAT